MTNVRVVQINYVYDFCICRNITQTCLNTNIKYLLLAQQTHFCLKTFKNAHKNIRQRSTPIKVRFLTTF